MDRLSKLSDKAAAVIGKTFTSCFILCSRKIVDKDIHRVSILKTWYSTWNLESLIVGVSWLFPPFQVTENLQILILRLPRTGLKNFYYKYMIELPDHFMWLLPVEQWVKVYSQGVLWQQTDLDIWTLHVFLSQVTKSQSCRARHSWKRAFICGT